AMAAGGIYDHVGGGFHRYATDVRWRVPHFEKMLYDNALLALVYLEAYQVTRRDEFARVVRETLAYVGRDLSAPGGGFYSASDADSEGVEGKFFTWTAAEVRAALPPEQAALALAYYDVRPAGANILHVSRPLAAVAGDLAIDPAAAPHVLQEARGGLDVARRRRVPPHTDQKVLAAWNGLMLSAFARAGQVLGDGALVDRAARAADFLLAHLRRGERLARSWLDGRTSGDAYLEDYAFVVAGLLDLYEASFDARWLREALALQSVLDLHYWDAAGGGYFRTADDGERLLAREKPATDGAGRARQDVPARRGQGGAPRAGDRLRLRATGMRSPDDGPGGVHAAAGACRAAAPRLRAAHSPPEPLAGARARDICPVEPRHADPPGIHPPPHGGVARSRLGCRRANGTGHLRRWHGGQSHELQA